MRNRQIYGKKKSSGNIWLIILLAVLVAGAYMFTSESFERNRPIIQAEEFMYWNRTDPLKIRITDDTALKQYEVHVSDGTNEVILEQEGFLENVQEKIVDIVYPKKALHGVMLDPRATDLKITITATDKSSWNFFQGNSVSKVIKIKVDYTRPDINVLANSYSVTRGGSGLVIFQVKDEALEGFYVEADGHRFKAQPYKKEGYYVTLIAWPFTKENFVANIVAIDKAGNERITNIPFYLMSKNYQTSWIQAKDSFIDGKITDLIASEPKFSTVDDRLEKLKTINETMRIENEDLIHKLSSNVSDDILESWQIKKFYPLKNAAKVASFGDDRHYYYEEKEHEVSESYHVGLDLASTKMANIVSSNAGKVVFSDYNGIYGNMPMIDHGLGLYTLYGHCANILVNVGEEVSAGFNIAQTGKSGLALGDHLHFGILVQGIEVRPEEWMDTKWIQDNIDKVFQAADKIIKGE